MRYYIVDAFAEKLFQGNQAGVCIMDKNLDAATMQKIAAENNMADTAFVIRNGNRFDLRWFTPEVEIDLCGHATLASAYIITRFVDSDADNICFNTLSGVLTVTRKHDFFEMDFHSRPPARIEVTYLMQEAVGCDVLEAHCSRELMLLVKDESTVQHLQPDMRALRQIPDCPGVIVTAKGDVADFVSRFFTPNAGIPGDPVTGSSHCALIPFWADRLGKTRMSAKQLSKRRSALLCELSGERVKIAGKAALYLSGVIEL